MKHIVISFLGKDKPGIVDTLAKVIKQHHGNWQTSSMRKLSGFFAGILEVSVDNEHGDALVAALKDIEGLQVSTAISEPELEKEETIRLDLTANDRTGIITEISSVIHAQGGNLVKLVSTQGNAPHFGQKLFKATATVAISGDEHIESLVNALEDIANDLIVDVIVS
ncbi:glycine cleavage system protein R [Thalassotalea mangrovi]|uniref:Glycine cleavage system transcriptional repressor n=1 Tax=Thalassotalea mangrovi TaxID=2572245 RepID=A0A4U1B485_9GAMM|nr:ACT domain-containing protein [Thalassotalea mangrovi]TKB44496.1 amino acid-binding protein [Thalassotalea mangrovi]